MKIISQLGERRKEKKRNYKCLLLSGRTVCVCDTHMKLYMCGWIKKIAGMKNHSSEEWKRKKNFLLKNFLIYCPSV